MASLPFYTSLLKSLSTLVFARFYTPQHPPNRDLTGQTAIVTGANSGIGLSIATTLAHQGATVYLACRSLERGNAAVEEVVRRVGDDSKERIYCWELDTSDLSSVRQFCEKWGREGRKEIDMLVHNAGITSPPNGGPTKTKEGLSIVYVTNFLGSFLMTCMLEKHLSPTARVVSTSSTGHYSARMLRKAKAKPSKNTVLTTKLTKSTQETPGLTSSAPAYAQSKAQQVLFTHLLQSHFIADSGNRRTAHVFTPGFTSTPIFGKLDVDWRTWISNPLFAILKGTEKYVAVDTDEGAKTGSWLASCGGEIEGGGFWEWLTRRTSLIDLISGVMGRERFSSFARGEWRAWETDVEMMWDIEL